jgi:hypothetical protein
MLVQRRTQRFQHIAMLHLVTEVTKGQMTITNRGTKLSMALIPVAMSESIRARALIQELFFQLVRFCCY